MEEKRMILFVRRPRGPQLNMTKGGKDEGKNIYTKVVRMTGISQWE